MLTTIILADRQAIFRAGAARVLAEADGLQIVAHCGEPDEVVSAIREHPGAVLLVSVGLAKVQSVRDAMAARKKMLAVLVVDGAGDVPADLEERFTGLMSRHVSPEGMVVCMYTVARGEPCYLPVPVTGKPKDDDAGARVRDQLTPKELQIVAMVTEGSKNVTIARRLRTREQVVKNSLRNIFDKMGVSDRLELALFVIHHPVLRDAADAAARKLRSSG